MAASRNSFTPNRTHVVSAAWVARNCGMRTVVDMLRGRLIHARTRFSLALKASTVLGISGGGMKWLGNRMNRGSPETR